MGGFTGDGVVFVDGIIWPGMHRSCEPAGVLERLRYRNVLGSAGRQDPDGETLSRGILTSRFPVLLCIATTPDQRVLLNTPSGIHPGPHLETLVADLAEATGCEVEIGGHHRAAPLPRFAEAVAPDPSHAPPGSGSRPDLLPPAAPSEPAVPSAVVVLSRSSVSTVAFLPKSAGAALEVAGDGPWSVVRFEEPPTTLDKAFWHGRDLPVLVLSDHLGSRHVSVLCDDGELPGPFTLTRLPDMRVPYAGAELSPEAARIAAVLSCMPLQPGSQVSKLLEHPSFAHSDVRLVAAAVQSPSDSGWFGRVLASLGLPTLAGNAFEGAELPGSFRLTPGGFLDINRQLLRHDRETDVIPGRPWHNLMARRPGLHVLFTTLRLLVGLAVVGAIIWLGLPWWGFIIIALVVVDVLDVIATYRTIAFRLRRRRGGRVSPG